MPLPQPLFRANTIQFGDTFLLIGGVTSNGKSSDRIYKFSTENEGWTELPVSLGEPKVGVAVMLVERSLFLS